MFQASFDGLKAALARTRKRLETELAAGRDGLELARLRADLLDEVLASHFEAACANVGVDPRRAPITLAAAGSYGRRAMGLRSDVDVRLIASSKKNASANVKALADAVLYPLWDAGLAIGHQLAHASELLALAKDDLATATTLIDLRAIAGDARPVRELVAKFASRMKAHPTELARALAEDTLKRHERYGDSVYLLEPDVKLGAGGLRDLEVARWTLAASSTRGDPLAVLVARGALDARELEAAYAAEAFAWRVRNRLHARGERRSDRLTFDAQESLALAMGDGGAHEGDEARVTATERFMQDHYVHARAISRVCDRATSVVLRPRRAKPAIADPAEIQRDPALALRVYARGMIDEVSRDVIARAMTDPKTCAALRESSEAASLFLELLCTLGDGAPIARELHDVGLVLAMIPEFLPVTGRVHHDVYHVLTVDVHSVAAVDCLRDLARGDLATEHVLASRLAMEIARPHALVMATLLHDVGKGHPSRVRKNHSVTGAELCDVVLPRFGFSADEIADARALVLHHLAMYHLATRRDLDDPATIDELCRIVRGREGLRGLYLLTIADITTTAPAAMTSWKAHMLEELYLRADARLGLTAPSDDDRVAAARAEVAALDHEAREFVESMPARYVLAMPPASIASHAALARSRRGRSVVVGLGPAHPSDLSEVCVVARDRPGLLARIAAAFAASKLEVSAAHVHTRSLAFEGEAVDVFFVRAAGGAEAVARKLSDLTRDLEDLSADRISPHELVASRLGSRSPWPARKTPDVPAKVAFDDRTAHHTIVEVFAKDQPGLLFRLARAIEELGLVIAVSKINTEGTKVADVFYVQELDGRKVSGKERLEAIRDLLLEASR